MPLSIEVFTCYDFPCNKQHENLDKIKYT